MKKFSFKVAIKTGWQLFKNHWKFIIPLGFITIFAQLFVNGMQQASLRHNAALGLALMVVMLLISIIITIGWSQVFLSLVRTGSADWDTFKSEPRLWLHLIKVLIWYFLYTLWYLIIAVVPFVVIILIGAFTHVQWLEAGAAIATGVAVFITVIYMRIRYQFITFAVIDFSGYRSRYVFKKAGHITEGSLWRLFAFAIVLALIEILGFICLLVGLIIAAPLVKIAQTKVYDMLKSHNATA